VQKSAQERFADWCAALAQRLDRLAQDQPIAFRRQNGGEYVIPALTLREDLAEGEHGFGVHVAR